MVRRTTPAAAATSLLDSALLEDQELRSATGAVAELSGSVLVMRHKHVKRADGRVQKVAEERRVEDK